MVGGGGVPETLLDTKGQIHGFTDVNAAVDVGANDTIVYADSTNAAGIAYGASAKSTLTTTGDLLAASSANTLSRIAASATSGQVLTSTGASSLPTYQTISADSDVLSQILIMGNSTTIGDYTNPTATTCSSEFFTPVAADWTWDGSSTGWTLGTGCANF